MSNIEKYNKVFKEVFMIDDDICLENLQINESAEWDSVGHISLITGLEDTFGIEFKLDDILGFISYKAGMTIMSKYGVEL